MTEQRIDGGTLDGVSATTLWTLRNRAVEAMRPDGLIDDPLAVRLYEAIDYDYDRFGKPSQSHPLRALAIDHAITDYLTGRPNATVVALGEGLQTTYWRLGRPEVDWLSIDLAPVIDVRAALLPDEPRITSLPMSALDRSWMERVDPARGVFIAAEGLFMYLDRAEVMSLIADCAQRFPGGQLIFDSIPRWLSNRTLKGMRLTDRYTVPPVPPMPPMPPMPFSLSVAEAARLPQEITSVATARDVLPPHGRGLWSRGPARVYATLPYVRNQRPSLTLLTFTTGTQPGCGRRVQGASAKQSNENGCHYC